MTLFASCTTRSPWVTAMARLGWISALSARTNSPSPYVVARFHQDGPQPCGQSLLGGVPVSAAETAVLRVLVADGHRTFADLLAMALEGSGDFACVGRAATAAQALLLIAELRPDVVVLDTSLLEDPPGPSPEETLAALRAAHPAASLVVLFSRRSPELVQQALAAGDRPARQQRWTRRGTRLLPQQRRRGSHRGWRPARPGRDPGAGPAGRPAGRRRRPLGATRQGARVSGRGLRRCAGGSRWRSG